VTISNSIASNATSAGIYVQNGAGSTKVAIEGVTLSSNSYGIQLQSGVALLGHSVIVGSSNYSIFNDTNPSTFYTYQNNEINLNGNGNAVDNYPLITVAYQ